eukprot:CAMPEP_0174879022 /NCGR_PEP_ID=MMETSP1114-20130205/83051_1 /TAXON_ID=312471 /ORGANISM="Neobodo designis, Strain CCAP 1951/1" /LENGTH=1016 /DNA_ID=CAMNT_0016114411 /DNA_START=48 /DNA_END=3099 /DNA_ORIENTATION=-
MTELVNRVRTLNQQALQLLRGNQLDEADRLLQEAQREIAESGIAHTPEVIAAKITTLNNLGCSAKRRGAHLKAVTCFETAMSLERHVGRDVSPTTLINLSTALTAMGDTERACAVAAECLAIVPKTDGPMRVVAMHNLAVARHCAGDRQAVPLMKKALELAAQTLGENHATTTQIRTRLYEWAPQHASAKSARATTNSRGQPMFAPAPPLTGRQAAARALRSLDFGTPDLPTGGPAGTRTNTSGTARSGSLAVLPPREEVMAGATFTDGLGQPPSPEKLPPLGTNAVVSTSRAPTTTEDDASVVGASTGALPPITPKNNETAGSQPQSAHGAPLQPTHSEAAMQRIDVAQARRKKGEPRPPAHNFCRFAHDALTKAPPTRISFSDVKSEMRSARSATDAGADDDDGGRGKSKKDVANPFQRSVQQKSKRLELEAAEERAFLARRAKQEEAEAKERERHHKALLVALSRRTHAARIIQNRYRRWRAQNKALLDMKRQQEQKESVSRAKSVVNFAQKWLKRTAGKRLVARMTHTKTNFEGIDAAVRKLQRAWRACHARILRRRLEASRAHFSDAVVAPERRTFAALIVQTWYRQRRALWALRRRRRAKYLSHCITIQRWIRGVFHQRRSRLSVKHREAPPPPRQVPEPLHHDPALDPRCLPPTALAAKRQAPRAPREHLRDEDPGPVARRRGAVPRLDAPLPAEDQGDAVDEVRCIMHMQRVCRGGHLRVRLWRYKRDAADAQRRIIDESRRLEPPTIVGVERMSASAAREALDGPTPRPLKRHTAQEAIAADEERRALEVELAVEPMRRAARQQFSPGLSRLDVERRRAAEMHLRDQERTGFMRARSAIVIQRALRRYFKSQTFGERQRFSAMRSAVAAQHVERNSAAAKEDHERAKRRQVNDLAKPIREERVALQQELADVPAPPDFVEHARTIEERQRAAAELHRTEAELARQLEREKEAMRQAAVRERAVPKVAPPPEPVTAQQQMFLTHKQRRAMAAAERGRSAVPTSDAHQV